MILPCNLEWIGSRNRKFPLFSRLLQFCYLWKIGSISESGQLILIYFGSILILIWSRNERSVQLPNLLCAIFLTHNQNPLNYVFDFQKRFCSQILKKIKSGSEIDAVIYDSTKKHFKLVNRAHAQERVVDMMWRMALAHSLARFL